MWPPLCVSQYTGKVPRPFGETTNGTEINSCLHFEHLYIGTGIVKVQQLTQVPVKQGHGASEYLSCEQPGTLDSIKQGRHDSPDDDDTKYIRVLKDITGLVTLEPASAANAENAAAGLQRWCTTLGVPSVLVSD